MSMFHHNPCHLYNMFGCTIQYYFNCLLSAPAPSHPSSLQTTTMHTETELRKSLTLTCSYIAGLSHHVLSTVLKLYLSLILLQEQLFTQAHKLSAAKALSFMIIDALECSIKALLISYIVIMSWRTIIYMYVHAWLIMKTVSRCLHVAQMKGCWDPEFEYSVEEIMDYRWYNIMAILSVRFLWRSCTRGEFPIQSST